MKILVASPSEYEISPFISYLNKQYNKVNFFEYERNGMHIFPFVTGPGMMQSAFALGKLELMKDMDHVICTGLCAAITRVLDIGQVVHIISEQYGDFGIEEPDGTLKDIHELALVDANLYPFKKSKIQNEKVINPLKYKVVQGMSVNMLHGSTENIERMNHKYHADVESLDGISFAYACAMNRLKYSHLRAVSQFIEPSHLERPDLDLAIDNLNEAIIRTVHHFSQLA